MSEIKFPDYSHLDAGCVALLGRTRQTRYDAGVKTESVGDEIMYFPVRGVDDLTHVEQVRRTKGYAVVGFNQLENIYKRTPAKAKEAAQIQQQLAGLVSPPEMKRKLAEAEAEKKALEAELAAARAAIEESAEKAKAPKAEKKQKQSEASEDVGSH